MAKDLTEYGDKENAQKKKIHIGSKFLNIKFFSILFMLGLCFASASAAEEAETIKDVFVKGKISGTLGNYFEYVSSVAPDANHGWSSTYISLKYETMPWKRLGYGVRVFAHGETYSDHEDGTTEPFDTDIEQVITIPEMYFDYGFLEASSLRVGRWNHKKVSHIDDAQSEGVYVKIKEIPDTELIVGTMRRFAEIDYDDGEDFGRDNGSQDLDSETFGSGSSSHLVFVEGRYTGLENISFNPYFMYHGNCANVVGLDSVYKSEWEKYEITYGGTVKYYHVNADSAGRDDADVFFIMPEIAKGPFSLEFLYGQYSDGDAYNRPGWLRDYSLLDQTTGAAMAGGEAFETKIKYKQDKYWAHVGYGKNNFETSATKGDGSQEVEFQVGYNFTKALDINLRYMDVQFDNIADKDYSKVESRIRYKF